MAIDATTGAVTDSAAELVVEPKVAEMVAIPTPVPLARPAELTAPIVGLEEVQLADCVTSRIEPSL